MVENIVFALLVVIAIGAGIWVWWRECHGEIPQPPAMNEQEGE